MPLQNTTTGDEHLMTPRPIPITAAEMRRRIAVRFGRTSGNVPVPEHLVVFEVAAAREATYYRRLRRIDAVAVGMLRRTEWLIHGFEIKVSRGDLRSELNEPAKAADAARFCDRWWLAISDPSLLRPTDVLPPHWGVIAAGGRGLRVLVEPQPIDRVESPEFRAAILHAGQRSPGYRRAMGYQAGLQRGLDEARRAEQRGYDRGVLHGRWAAQDAATRGANA